MGGSAADESLDPPMTMVLEAALISKPLDFRLFYGRKGKAARTNCKDRTVRSEGGWTRARPIPHVAAKGVLVMSESTKGYMFFLLILLTLLVAYRQPKCECETEPAPADLEELIKAGVTFTNFTPSKKNMIRDELARLTTKRCTAAFEKAHLRSPRRLLVEAGVIFRPAKDVYLYSARDLGLVDERTRQAYALDLSSCRVQAATVSPVLGGVRRTIDARPRFFLHETAFYGESYLLGTYSFHEVIVHEFIHAGGQPPAPGWFFQHDLASFPHYDKIMRACE
jgi:hypothetical protein